MKNQSLKIIVSIAACLVFFLFFGSETGMAKERIDGETSYNEVNFDLGIWNCEKADFDFSPEGWKDSLCYFWIREDQKDDMLISYLYDITNGLGDVVDNSYLKPIDSESKDNLFYVTTDAGVDYPALIEYEYFNFTFNMYKGIPIPSLFDKDFQLGYFYFTIPEAMNFQSLVFPKINKEIMISYDMELNTPNFNREILNGFPESIIIDDIQIDFSSDWVVISEGSWYKLNSLIKVKNLDMTQQKEFNISQYFGIYNLRTNSQCEINKPYFYLAPLQEEERVLDFTIKLGTDSDDIFLIAKFDSNKFYKIKYRVDYLH